MASITGKRRFIPLLLVLAFGSLVLGSTLALGAAEIRPWTWAPVLPATLFLLLFTSLLCLFENKEIIIADKTTLGLIAALVGLCLISTLMAPATFDATIRLHSLLAALFFFIAVTMAFTERQMLPYALSILIGVGFLVAAVGLMHYLGFLQGPWPTKGLGLKAPFPNHNHAAGFLEMIIPLGVALLFARLTPAIKLLVGYATFVMVTAHVFTLSRGGWVSLAFSLILLGIFRLAHSRKRTILLLAALGLFLVLAMVFQIGEQPIDARLATLTDNDLRAIDQFRIAFSASALRMGVSNPLFGVGLGHFFHNFASYRPDDVFIRPRFVHNDYFQAFAELGFPGLIIVMLIAVHILAAGIRTTMASANGSLEQQVAVGSLCGCAALLLHSFVDFNLHVTANACLFAFMAALCLRKRTEVLPTVGRVPFIAAAFVLMVLFGWQHQNIYRAGVAKKRAEMASAQKQHKEAVNAYLEATKYTPSDAEAWLGLARAHRARAKFARSLELKEKATSIFKEAQKAYQKTLQLNPLRTRAMVEVAEIMGNQGLLINDEKLSREAVKLFRQALTIDPKNPYYRALLGFRLLALNEVDEAIKTLGALFRDTPKTGTLLDRTLKIVVDVVQDPAIIAKLVPKDSIRGHLTLATLLDQNDRWDEARPIFGKALAVNPDDYKALTTYAAAAYKHKDWKLARRLYERVAAVKPLDWIYLRLAEVARQLKNKEDRRRWLEAAITVAPDKPWPRICLANFLAEEGETAKAKQSLLEVSIKYSDDHRGPLYLGKLAQRLKEHHRAVEHFREAKRRKPESHQIRNSLAWSYVHIGLPIKAYRIWDEALKQFPKQHYYLGEKARAHYYQREYSRAYRTLLQYAQLVPQGKWRGKTVSEGLAELEKLLPATQR